MPTRLPPIVDKIKNGKITLKKLDVDYDTLGYVLTCHLIIEHYMSEFLKNRHPDLNWSSAGLKFIKMVELLSKYPNKEDNSITPSLKRLNKLRNQFSHDIKYKMTDKDLQPLVQFLKKSIRKGEALPTNEREILSNYTYLVSYWLEQVLELTVKGEWEKRKKGTVIKGQTAWAEPNGSIKAGRGVMSNQSSAEPD